MLHAELTLAGSEIGWQPLRPTTGGAIGIDLLHDPTRNKGTAFTEEERDSLELRGLLPPRVLTQSQQVQKVLENFRNKTSDIEKYVYLISLHDRNERLFYRVVIDHLAEMMPIIYTPTVGLACQLYGHVWRRPQGLFITAHDRGRIADVMKNWPYGPVRIIVVTDGERILGLGDLGANGMGIPVGKLSLYTACAGVNPTWCLPITLDVGTNNEQLLADPLYCGVAEHRLRDGEYDTLVDEFMQAVKTRFPQAVVQFEDFGNENAFRILRRYQDKTCCFNDDIQGTAAVCLAGLLSANRRLGIAPLTSQTLLFLGAGEAGVGIADLIVRAMTAEGLSLEDARKRCWFLDSKGLVVASRTNLAEHKRPYAHDHEPLSDLVAAVKAIRPTALIGVSGKGQTFTRPAIEVMSEINERPCVFALSNPTANAECTAEQAYLWSRGRAIFASGSPFPPVQYEGRQFVPGQANNAYVFPGIGLGLISCGARRATPDMFLAAARTLAAVTLEADAAQGCLFPSLARIREISASIAADVCEVAYPSELATVPQPKDLRASIQAGMFDPAYD